MNIVRVEVLVASPDRNFVTLRLTTDDGLVGLGDGTLNGRELAVASYLQDHVAPLLLNRDAHRIEDAAAHPQKTDLQRQPQLKGRSPPLLDHLSLSRREREERLDLEGRQLTRDLLQTEKCGLPRVHCTLRECGAISSQKSGAATD